MRRFFAGAQKKRKKEEEESDVAQPEPAFVREGKEKERWTGLGVERVRPLRRGEGRGERSADERMCSFLLLRLLRGKKEGR